MTPTSVDIIQDIDNPQEEQLIIKLSDNPTIEDIENAIDQYQADEWAYKSHFICPPYGYLIFVRPTKTSIDWYARMIDNYPDVVFNRA